LTFTNRWWESWCREES